MITLRSTKLSLGIWRDYGKDMSFVSPQGDVIGVLKPVGNQIHREHIRQAEKAAQKLKSIPP